MSFITALYSLAFSALLSLLRSCERSNLHLILPFARMPAVIEVPLCTIEEGDESARTSPRKEDINSLAPEINLDNGSNRSSVRIPSYYVQSRPQSTLSLAPSFDLNNLILLPAKAYQPPGTHHDVPSLGRPRSEIMPVVPPPGLYTRIDSSALRVPSYVQPRPQSTQSLAPPLDLNDFILLPAKAYQPPGTHHDVPSSARPENETISLDPPHALSRRIDSSSLRVLSYVRPRPQSILSPAPSLDLKDFISSPAKAYQPPGTYHGASSSARPESETIPPMSPPHGLNIWIDGEKRLSTLNLEDARCLLVINPWQMERSHRPLLQNGRLLRSSILSTEKPLPPLPPLPRPDDDVSAESFKQTPTEETRVAQGSLDWSMNWFPPRWSTQATGSMTDERGSLHEVLGTRRETALSEEEPPAGKSKLHRASTIPKWVKDWRRSRASRAERNRYADCLGVPRYADSPGVSRNADSLEALPTCRESHFPEFVQPEDRPPDTGSRAFLQVLGGFFIMLNTL